jgi:hypothetical protein
LVGDSLGGVGLLGLGPRELPTSSGVCRLLADQQRNRGRYSAHNDR